MMGLKEIYRDVLALNSPFLIKDDEELDYVLGKMQPRFEEEFEKNGFKILTLMTVGWVCLFSRHPVIYPSDLQAQKLAMNEDDPSIVRAWRAIGFKVFPISVTDLTIGLQTGMVDAFYTTPVAAAVFQWFATANQMCSFRISPVFGGILIDERVWRRIPDEIKPSLMKSVEEAKKALCDEMSALESEALDVMRNHGLIIHQIPKEAEQHWRSIMKRGTAEAVDSSFSREIYERVCELLSEFRARRTDF